MYDVIVVGAGPGGASAAYFLSQAGLRVLVLEKENIPRYKVCGGGVSIRMLENYFPFSFDSVIEDRADSITYVNNHRWVKVPLAQPSMVTVMRDRFDAYILSHAQAEVQTMFTVQGVQEENDQVTVRTNVGRTFTGRYLIGADGANSVVARVCGLRRGKVMAAAIEAEAPTSTQVLTAFRGNPSFIFGPVRMGYGWIFPKTSHLSVGVAALRPRPGEIQTALSSISDRFGLQLSLAKIHGYTIPIHVRHEAVSTQRILLVGDAAGLADPLSGEGIRLAIKSAFLATQAIIQHIPERYPYFIREYITDDMRRLAVPLAKLFYNAPELCYWFGERNPVATQAFMDLLSDQSNYSKVVLQLVGTLPVYLITEAVAMTITYLGRSQWSEQLRNWIYFGPP